MDPAICFLLVLDDGRETNPVAIDFSCGAIMVCLLWIVYVYMWSSRTVISAMEVSLAGPNDRPDVGRVLGDNEGYSVKYVTSMLTTRKMT